MPINSEHLASLTDADVIDQAGDKVGGVGQIYLDDATGTPAWVSVKSGLFGLRESFVPLAAADVVDGNIKVPYTKDFIKDAPKVDADNHLDDTQQETLFRYYGVERPAAVETTGGAPDRTATFGSEETAEDLYDGRTESEPTPDAGEQAREADLVGSGEPGAEVGQDGAVTSEYTTPGADEDPTAGGAVADGGYDLGSGEVAEASEPAAASGPSPWDAAAIGAGAAVGTVGAAGAAQAADDEPAAEAYAAPDATETSDVYAAPEATETGDVYAAPETTELPVESSAPAEEPVGGEAVTRPTAEQIADAGGNAEWAETQQAHYQHTNPAAQADWAAEQSPEEPVSTEWHVPSTDPATEEATAVSRGGYSPDQPAAHSSAYEGHDSGSGTLAAAAAAAGAGGVAGAAAAGAASDTDTTAYEVPGAEQDAPATDVETGDALADDVEAPTDGATLPAGTDGGDASGEPDAEPAEEVFGPEGYQEDRDGTGMTDEERARLNEARGAL